MNTVTALTCTRQTLLNRVDKHLNALRSTPSTGLNYDRKQRQYYIATVHLFGWCVGSPE